MDGERLAVGEPPPLSTVRPQALRVLAAGIDATRVVVIRPRLGAA
jgi:hypothetical protein